MQKYLEKKSPNLKGGMMENNRRWMIYAELPLQENIEMNYSVIDQMDKDEIIRMYITCDWKRARQNEGLEKIYTKTELTMQDFNQTILRLENEDSKNPDIDSWKKLRKAYMDHHRNYSDLQTGYNNDHIPFIDPLEFE